MEKGRRTSIAGRGTEFNRIALFLIVGLLKKFLLIERGKFNYNLLYRDLKYQFIKIKSFGHSLRIFIAIVGRLLYTVLRYDT
jgi:hypothetical protein